MGRIAGVTAEETRERLPRAAADVFARRGRDGTRVADIATVAGRAGPLVPPARDGQRSSRPGLHAVADKEWAALLIRVIAGLTPPAISAQTGTAQ